MKTTTVKEKKKVEYFTDEMHRDMFPFQPAISARGYGGSKPVIKPLVFKSGKK